VTSNFAASSPTAGNDTSAAAITAGIPKAAKAKFERRFILRIPAIANWLLWPENPAALIFQQIPRNSSAVAGRPSGFFPGEIARRKHCRVEFSDLPINFPAMAHAVDPHLADGIRDFVNHSIIAHTDAPVVSRSGKFPATWRTGISSHLLKRFYNPVVNVSCKAVQIPFRGAFEEDVIHATWIFSPTNNPRAGDSAMASGAPA
jgi:hypothetical protein